MRLRAHRLSAELPQGWDGRIFSRRVEVEAARPAGRRADEARGRASSRRHEDGRGERAATMHAANFALPVKDGDFGTAATARMSARGAFVALTEYLPGNGLQPGVGLFARRGAPQRLKAAMFSPRTLLLARPGQAGVQRFFTHRGRPFCLYVVLGAGDADRLLPQVNSLLASLEIGDRKGR